MQRAELAVRRRPPSLARIIELPFWSLAAMVLLVTFDNAVPSQIQLPQGSRSIVWVLGCLTGVMWLVRMVVTGEPIRLVVAPLAIILAWVLVALVGSIDAVNRGRAIAALSGMIEFFALFVLVQNLVTTRRHLTVLVLAFVIGSMAISLIMLSGAAAAFERSGRATIAANVNPNTTSYILASACLLGLYLISRARSLTRRSLSIVATAVILIAVFATGSISAIAALAGAIGVCGFLAFRRHLFRAVRSAAVPSLVLIIAFVAAAKSGFIPERALDRTTFGFFEGSSPFEVPKSVKARTDIHYVALNEMVWWNPVFGIGPGQFAPMFRQASFKLGIPRQAPDPHSIYLKALIENGVIGLLLVSALFITTLRRLIRWSPAPLALMGIGLVVCSMVIGLTHTVFHHDAFWILLAMAIAAGSILEREYASRHAPARLHARAVA